MRRIVLLCIVVISLLAVTFSSTGTMSKATQKHRRPQPIIRKAQGNNTGPGRPRKKSKPPDLSGLDPAINPYLNLTVDFKPYRDMVQKLFIDNPTLYGDKCNIPDGAIMFSYANQHLLTLLRLRYDIMKAARALDCVEKRFITVCLDETCLKECQSYGLKNVVWVQVPETPMTGFGMVADKIQRFAFGYMSWLKYEMMFESLKVATEVMYLDADVMIYDNPFLETPYGRDDTGKKIPGPYEVMFQRERGIKEKGCRGEVNGGLIYLRNTTRVHERFIPGMRGEKAEIVSATGRQDQDIVLKYVGPPMARCTLPVSRYVGFCPWSQDARASPKKAITFHTNCVSGLNNKIQKIKQFSARVVGGDLGKYIGARHGPSSKPGIVGAKANNTTSL